MTFELNDEQRAFQDMARHFAGEAIAPYAAAWDEAGEFPVETLRRAATLGLAGIYVRAASGGRGLSRFGAAAVRSAERRVGQECVSAVRDRWWPNPKKKNQTTKSG